MAFEGVQADPVADAEVRHAGKSDAVKVSYMWMAWLLAFVITPGFMVFSNYMDNLNRVLDITAQARGVPSFNPGNHQPTRYAFDDTAGTVAMTMVTPNLVNGDWTELVRIRCQWVYNHYKGGQQTVLHGEWFELDTSKDWAQDFVTWTHATTNLPMPDRRFQHPEFIFDFTRDDGTRYRIHASGTPLR